MSQVVIPTREEIEARSKELAGRILEGGEDHIQWAREKWDCCQATAYNYMNRARLMLADNTDIRLEFGRGLERLHTCQTGLMHRGDFADAVRAQAEINKMLGLNAPEKLLVKSSAPDTEAGLALVADKMQQLIDLGMSPKDVDCVISEEAERQLLESTRQEDEEP